jgi:hypothetical protein
VAALDREPLDISGGAATGLSAGACELLAALEHHGALHLNSTPRFPNVSDLDGAWRDAMDLVAGKYCFLSRLVGGKTTYLSLRLYEACASLLAWQPSRGLPAMLPGPPPAPLAALARDLYDILEQGGATGTGDLCGVLTAEPRPVREAITWLQRHFYVAVTGPGRALTPNWDTYLWCTRRQWEKECPFPLEPPPPAEARRRIAAYLASYLSERGILRILASLTSGA